MARILFLCTGAIACLSGPPVLAAWVTISPARGEVRLCITDIGDCTSPTGTRPPTVTFTVPAAQLGNGTAIAGTPILLQFEMSVRRPLGGPNLTATMTATAPAALISGGNQIPITDISWVSAVITPGAPAGTTPIPNGSFVAGQQTIVSIATTGGGSVYAGGALTFYFANTTIYPQGTYGPATVNYTASRNP